MQQKADKKSQDTEKRAMIAITLNFTPLGGPNAPKQTFTIQRDVLLFNQKESQKTVKELVEELLARPTNDDIHVRVNDKEIRLDRPLCSLLKEVRAGIEARIFFLRLRR